MKFRLANLSLLVAGLMLVVYPVVILGAVYALLHSSNDLLDWIPEGTPARRAYTDFTERFGTGEIAIVSWPGCTMDDARLAALAAQLRDRRRSSYFDRVTTGPELVEQLTTSRFELTEQQARESLAGHMIGPDSQTTCVMIALSELGRRDRLRAFDAIHSAAEATSGLKAHSLRYGGPAVLLYEMTLESLRSPLRLGGVAIVVVAAMTWVMLRSITLTALVVGLSLFNSLMSVALVGLVAGGMNAILMPLPTLTLVLSVSACVHVINYFRQESASDGPDLAERTLRNAWLPIALSAATTAIGLIALCTSKTTPVREFGAFAAAAILLATGLVVLTLPGLLGWLPQRFTCRPLRRSSQGRPGGWKTFAAIVDRARLLIVVTGLLIIVGGAFGVLRLGTTLTVGTTFSENTRVVQDSAWLEEHVAALGRVEVLLALERNEEATPLDQLRLVERCKRDLLEVAEVDGALSLGNFVPPIPQGRGSRSTIRRALMNGVLEDAEDELRDSGYWWQDDQHTWCRISVQAPMMAQTEYGVLMRRVTDQLEDTRAHLGNREEVHFECTGLIPLIDHIQIQMLRDLFWTYATALLAMTLTMCLFLRSVKAGVLSMLPNVFPAVAVLGALGWLGLRLDVGSIMTASVALGIAVDGTLHFLTWFRRGLTVEADGREAVLTSFRHCGLAILQGALICAVGVHWLSYSDFIPTARFGFLVATMLAAALVGDLVLLPALLLTRIGTFRSPLQARQQSGSTHA